MGFERRGGFRGRSGGSGGFGGRSGGFGGRSGGGFRDSRFERSSRPAPVNVGEEYDTEITETGDRGDGIARIKNFVVFVPGTKKGDHVKIRIKEVHGRSAVGEIVGEGSEEPAGEAPVVEAEVAEEETEDEEDEE